MNGRGGGDAMNRRLYIFCGGIFDEFFGVAAA